MQPLITFTSKGLFCAQGNFYIDPWVPVDYAIITHGHSDHAYNGHKHYLCHNFTKPILQYRLGENNYQSVGWNETVHINGVAVTFFPAGHVIGSSQIRVEYRGEIWVASGDYKTEDDGISGQFEPVPCHHFITESTFGLPIYSWKPQQEIYNDIILWINKNKEHGKASVLLAYSLGKAQRVIQAIKETTQDIYAHGAVYNMQHVLIQNGWDLHPVIPITNELPKEKLKGAVIIAPPSADSSPWIKKLQPYATGFCSGWMQVRGHRRRRNADAGFAMSDHADFDGLIAAVKSTGAENVYVTHGFQAAFSRYLNEEKIALAAEVKTQFGNEEEGKEVVEIVDETNEG